jgi:insulysin
MATVYEGEIDVSANDVDRSYRHVTLGNDLSILLISDPTTDKAAACCDVRVGSMQNKEILGLAHFLEHMLFLGTETYPSEEEYSAFLNKNGGSSNAYTSGEDTVYFFDVTAGHLEGALERFAAFFICPLFTEAAVDREMNAVDSENSKNLQIDEWRAAMLLSSLAKPEHPYSKFGTGNLATLSGDSIDARAACIDFHKKHYSSNIMKAVIQGKESLDELQAMAEKYFSAIPNKGLPGPPKVDPEPFTGTHTGKMLRWVPVKDKKVVSVFFPIPATQHEYEAKPAEFLAHLLGHESGGSVLAALKEAGLANGLGAYEYRSYATFAIFGVAIDLTDEGVQRADEVVASVFAYIAMLNKSQLGGADAAWIGQELQEVYDMTFRFKSKAQPYDYVADLANQMHMKPVSHIISGKERVFDTSPAKAVALLAKLTPANAIVMLRDKSFEGATDKKCPWYGTDYSEAPFSSAQLEQWQQAYEGGSAQWADKLHLPSRNDLVATDFSLKFDAGDDTQLKAQKEKETVLPVPVLVRAEEKSTYEKVYVDGKGAIEEAAPASSESVVASPAPAAGTPHSGVPTLPRLPHVAWHRADWTFRQPKVNIKAKLVSPLLSQDPASQALADLFCSCLEELLTDFSYYAECANLHYSVSLAEDGLQLGFSGFHHKMPELLARVCETMRGMADAGDNVNAVPQATFDRMKDYALRKYANECLEQPFRQAMVATVTVLKVPRWSNLDKYAALQGLTLADMNSYGQRMLQSGMRIELLSHGNASKEDAAGFVDVIAKTLRIDALPAAQVVDKRLLRLATGTDYYYRQHCAFSNPAEVNSAIDCAYFVHADDYVPALLTHSFLQTLDAETSARLKSFPVEVEIDVMCKFLCHVMSDAAFHQLRTIEQLGYIVYVFETENSLLGSGVRLLIQSDKKDAHHLDGRIENFFGVFVEKHLENSLKDAGTFQSNVTAVIELLTEQSKNLGEETRKMWWEVSRSRYAFEFQDQCAELLQHVTLEHLRAFYDRYIAADAPLRCKFVSQYFSKDSKFPAVLPKSREGSTKTVLIEDVAAFKRGMPLQANTKQVIM